MGKARPNDDRQAPKRPFASRGSAGGGTRASEGGALEGAKRPASSRGSAGGGTRASEGGALEGAKRPASALARVALVAGVGLAAGLLALAAVGCKTDASLAAKHAVAPPPKEFGLRPFGPARYVEQSSRWVERAEGSVDRVILNGRRAEIQGTKILRNAPAEPEVDGAVVMPSWVKGPARYLFWDGKQLYGAATFLGDLVKITKLPADVSGTPFEWLDGLGIQVDGATFMLVPGTAADMHDARLTSLTVPGGVYGIAADANRALVINVFGHALLTIDGGKSYRDVNEEVGEVHGYEVRGNDLVLETSSGRDRFVSPAGKIGDAATSPGPLRGARPPDLEDAWAELSSDDAGYELSRRAIPLGDGTVLVVSGDKLAKVDAASGRVISSTTLEDVSGEGCTPLKVPDALLLACENGSRAMVIDVTGVPKVERTFEVSDESDERSSLDSFSAADGVGIGYLGPCEGLPPVRDDVDGITGASSRNQSSQRSPVFCSRAGADHWIEHRLDAEDAADVIGWMPRPGGDAVALIARTGRVVTEQDRVGAHGGLRIVRIPRTEPPLALSGYSSRGRESVARDMRAGADGSIEAWLSNNNYGNSQTSALIDAEGHVTVRTMPGRIDSLEAQGPFAMAHADDGRLFETVDWGKRWIEVQPPPGNVQSLRPSNCSPVGCAVGGYMRIGWDSVDPKLPAASTDYETSRVAARVLREKNEYRRPPPKTPTVRLACSYATPGEGARQPDSYGFGFTATSAARMGGGSSRLGWVGALSIPWWQGPMPTGLDVELAWVEPLDLDGRIHRATVPLSSAGVALQWRPHEVKLGYVMDEDGRLEVLPTGPKTACLGSLLEEAGVVTKLGGCVEDPAVGIRIKDRILVGSERWNGYSILAIDLPRSEGGAAAVGVAQRQLREVRTPSALRGFTVGIGVRAGLPVGVAVDTRGEAVLAPIDPNDGYIGEVERLAPLTALKIGTDAKCPTQEKLGPDEARVLFPFEAAIGLAKDSLPGVTATGSAGVAVVRWSKDSACLEAIEMNVRDDRFDPDGNQNYEPTGMLRKVMARFTKAPSRRGTLEKKPKPVAKGKTTAPASSASAAASVSPSAAIAALLSAAASPGAPPTPSASASASAAVTVAPIPVAPPLPKGAGEGTLLLIQYGFEVRQKLFCTGTTP
jgi:hypothetical protein